MLDLTNTVFREYHLIRCLGRGASSSVYLGEHTDLKILVAIKILHAYLSKKDGERFRNEARLITRLDHPNIVAAYAYDIEDGIPFIVMDYAPNGTLRQRYPKGTRLSNEDIVHYVTQVASALQYTHDRGRLVHRDVKPENMLLGPDEQVWLSDFGVSLLMPSEDASPSQEIAGTVRYMAPEQIRGKPCFASDQYALGGVVYEWLSGSCAFTGSPAEIAVHHINTAPPSLCEKAPAISPAVEEIVLRALEKAPQARFPTVRAFADALQEALEQASDPALKVSSKLTSSSLSSARWQPAFSYQEGSVLQLSAPSVIITPMPEVALSPQTNLPNPPEVVFRRISPQSIQASRRRRLVSRRSVIMGMTGLAFVAAGIAVDYIYMSNLHVQTPRAVSVNLRSKKSALPTSAPEKQRVVPAPARGATLYTYRGHTQAVKSVVWISNQRVASASLDSTVRIWDALVGGNMLVYTQHKVGVKAIAASPGDAYIASGDGNGKIHVWDVTSGDDRFASLSDGQAMAVRSIAWSPHGYSIASASEDGIVSIWNAQTGHQLFAYTGHSGPVRSVAWSPNGQFLASGSIDKTVQIWSSTNGKQRALLTYRGHTDIVWSVKWSPDGTRVASASQDGTVQVWNAITGSLIVRHVVPAGKAESVVWSPDGQFIASGSDDGTALIWNAVTGQHVLNYRQQRSTLWSLAWSSDGQHIASASDDTTVKVWQAR